MNNQRKYFYFLWKIFFCLILLSGCFLGQKEAETYLESNQNATFYIDGKEVGTGKRVHVKLLSDKPHYVVVKPKGYIAKEEYIHPPYDPKLPFFFTFLIGERESNVAMEEHKKELENKSKFEIMIIELARELSPQEDIPICIGLIQDGEHKRPSPLASFLIPQMEDELVRRGNEIVKQERLTDILEVQKRQLSDLYEGKDLPQLGRLIGVKAIILGKITNETYQCRVSLQLIDIERGTTKKSHTKIINYEDIPGAALLKLKEKS
jgi:hypothetical protein